MLVLKGVGNLHILTVPPADKVNQLLERDPVKRFGCKPQGEGYQELRRHPWFKTLDWDTLESKEQTPPFIPDVRPHILFGKNNSHPPQAKKANFDASHELEELLLEDNPLKAKARKANQDNLSAEMRQMEEQYVFIHSADPPSDDLAPLSPLTLLLNHHLLQIHFIRL